MTRFQAEIAALDELWQGRTIAVMLSSTQAGDHGASAATIQFHRQVLKSLWQQGPRGPPAPLPVVSEHMADYEPCVDAWATRIDPPAPLDANHPGVDPPPLIARGVTVGKRRVAAAEIGVALPGRGVREAVRHGDRVCKHKRVPKRFGFAKGRHRLRVAQMRVNIHETDFASEERRRFR